MKNLIHIIVWGLLTSSTCFAEDESLMSSPEIPEAISLEMAANQLTKDEHNRLLGAETEQIDDKSIHIIKVLTHQGHVRHFKFDAETGQLLNN